MKKDNLYTGYTKYADIFADFHKIKRKNKILTEKDFNIEINRNGFVIAEFEDVNLIFCARNVFDYKDKVKKIKNYGAKNTIVVYELNSKINLVNSVAEYGFKAISLVSFKIGRRHVASETKYKVVDLGISKKIISEIGHNDPAVVYLMLKVGDVIRFLHNSNSAGYYQEYRLVVETKDY